ncbi:hypothetical protein AMS68_005946 [Peltaster fructicola]|uniref:Major facilitator superfamily (MFS) profile domain-containing protein n=1 Tax=Peltaster fructicola TaxID=286661 RepID=A0A6H0Y0N2_9PEZI|nr:hypothetical protein AMS68_005946 [Peltaster fructicola]
MTEPQVLSSTSIQAIDWDGPNDPENPRNFSSRRRLLSVLAVTGLAFVSTFAASVYSPGIDEVASTYGTTVELATLPLSIFNLGLAFGPLIGAPLSETFGRKVVFLVTSPIFALFTLGAAFSTSLTSLTICRFFAAVFASPAVSNASASITDYTAGQHRALSLSFYYSIPTTGALLGPLVGGFVVLGKGWRWTQYVTIFFVVAFFIPVIFTRESYKKRLLEQRAKRRGIARPASAKKSLPQLIHHFLIVLFLRPVHMLLTEPIVTLVCVYSGFLFGLLYTFVISSPWVFAKYYNFDITGQSLIFLSPVIGTASTPIPLFLIDRFITQPQCKHFEAEAPGTQFPPERRLSPALIGSIALPITLFIFAWTVRPEIHWIVPLVFQGLAMQCSVMIYAPTNMFMIDSYGPLYGASASGAAMLSRYLLSAAFPLFTLQMYRALGVGWATTLLAFCTLAMAPIPWLFYRYGSRLRAKSKYETSS